MDSGMLTNWILSQLLKKVVVPTEFHKRCEELRYLQEDDISGLVVSLTDFAVNSATVDFGIETENDNLNNKLKEFLENVNIGFGGQIPSGIKALEKEYYKERWQASSFPILKIHKWERVNDLLLPTQMYFIDGESVYAEDITADDENLSLLNYKYYLGSNKEEKNLLSTTKNHDYIFTKPFARWHDKYPVPYLIKNGVYHNWKIIQSLKRKQTDILDQVLPYLLLIKKGSPELFNQGKTLSQADLQNVIEQMQNLMDEIKDTALGDKQIKTPIRATDFTEEIKHLIPDLSTIFDEGLFTVAEKNILSALGFIDIAEAVTSSRKESILNPTVFISGVKAGVNDFQQLLQEIYLRIKQKNSGNIKYMNKDVFITHSPVTSLMTEGFLELIRQQYDRGNLSRQTAVEILGADFGTEELRRIKEQKRGLDYTLYPPVVQNQEQFPDTPMRIDKDNEEIPDTKKNPVEKQNFKNATLVRSACPYCGNVIEYKEELEESEKQEWIDCVECGNTILAKDLRNHRTARKRKSIDLETAPYTRLKELPANVRKKLSIRKQRKWMSIFNSAYDYKLKQTGDKKKAEQYAFRVAWSRVDSTENSTKQIETPVNVIDTKKLLTAVENLFDKKSEKLLEDLRNKQELEINKKKSELLNKLLNKDKNENI